MNYLRAAQPPQPQGRGRRWASVFLALTMSLGAIVFATPPASADCYYQDPYTLLWIECALVEGEYEPGYDAAWTEYYEENSHNAGNSSSNNSGTSTGQNQQGETGEDNEDNEDKTDPCTINGLDKLCQVCTDDPDRCTEAFSEILSEAAAFATAFCGSDKFCWTVAMVGFVSAAYMADERTDLGDSLLNALFDDVGFPKSSKEDLLGWSWRATVDIVREADRRYFASDYDRSNFIRQYIRSEIRQLLTESAQGDGIGL